MVSNNSINNTSPGLHLTGSVTGTVSILPQASAGSYNFNLPTTAGTSGQLLASGGGSGAPMTWTSAAGGGITAVNVQTFTTTGTYTPTSGMVYVIARLVGGGGGAGSNLSAPSTGCAGAGGGYAEGLFSAATIGSSQTVTIGAAGSAGNSVGTAGGTGGTTSLGSLLTGTGGGGGGSTAPNPAHGGTGSGGYLAITGQGVTGQGPSLQAYGGNSQLGQGGAYALVGSPPVIPATGYGAGGGYVGTGTNGAGTAGIVIITEYIS